MASGAFLLLRKDAVVSRTQIDLCYESSLKISRRNRKYRDSSTVFMMLLSGKTQIRDALIFAGISGEEKEFLVAYESEDDFRKFRVQFSECSFSPDTGIPEDSESLDSKVFPAITDVIYELNRFHH